MLIKIPAIVGEKGLANEPIVESILIETSFVVCVDASRDYENARRITLCDHTQVDTNLEIDELYALISSGSSYTLELTPQQQLAINFTTG
tara:strand:- start:25685 stop:25954 length:270 start_codon:yes stop_codon:yes gene_type:complete